MNWKFFSKFIHMTLEAFRAIMSQQRINVSCEFVQDQAWANGVFCKVFQALSFLRLWWHSGNLWCHLALWDCWDSNLFQYTKKLVAIWFNYNQIEQVGHGLFTELTELTVAGFQRNPCIDAWAITPQQMQELILKLQLSIECSSLATTSDPPTTPTTMTSTATAAPTTPDPPTTVISTPSEPYECPDTCTNRMKEIERQMRDEVKDRMEELERRLKQLRSLSL